MVWFTIRRKQNHHCPLDNPLSPHLLQRNVALRRGYVGHLNSHEYWGWTGCFPKITFSICRFDSGWLRTCLSLMTFLDLLNMRRKSKRSSPKWWAMMVRHGSVQIGWFLRFQPLIFQGVFSSECTIDWSMCFSFDPFFMAMSGKKSCSCLLFQRKKNNIP